MPESLSVTDAAKELQVSRVTLSKILNGNCGVSAEMAIRLSQWLGTSPELWLNLQIKYDLWQAMKKDIPSIKHIAA